MNTELKSEAITNLPLAQYRNYQSLMNLVPGATPTQFQNALTDSPGRSLRTYVNGQNPNSNNTKSDGATNVNLWLPHHAMYVAPAETIDTVNISTSSFDAEQGMAGGAAITRDHQVGHQRVPGLGVRVLQLRRAQRAARTSPRAKTPLDRNIFGGTLGGPIQKNSLFFFGSYEGFFDRSTTQIFYDVPTAAMRNGDFSGDHANGTLQQSTTRRRATPTAPAARRLPATRSRQTASARWRRRSSATTRCRTCRATRATTCATPTAPVDRNNYDVKLNWNRTASHQLWGKYSQMDADVSNLFYLGVDGGGIGDTAVKQFTLGQTWTLNSSTVLDSTFGFSRQNQEVHRARTSRWATSASDTLGIPGTNGATSYADDPRYAGFPPFNPGFSAIGNNAGWNPLYRDERTYAFSTNVTKLMGQHEVRFGYSGNYLYLDHWQPGDVATPRGDFTFNGAATRLFGAGTQTANLYNQYAQFLLGYSPPRPRASSTRR